MQDISRIEQGFKVLGLKIKDGNRVLWESLEWGVGERTAILSREILECKIVCREIEFYSKEKIENLQMVQRIIYKGECIEEWDFQFGFVIPSSTNTWQNEVVADSSVIPAEEQSGHVVIETLFLEGQVCIHRSAVRIYYE